MKLLIFLAVLIPAVFAGQSKAQDTAKIEVIKLTWSMYDRNRVIDEPSLFDRTETVGLPGRSNRIEEKTIEEKSRELRRVESDARRSAAAPTGRIFLYEMKVKNTYEKTVKSFVWEYQTNEKNAAQNAASRKFLCTGKIKADDNKTLRFISHLPPVNVVDASVSNAESKKSTAIDVIINHIEFTDGTVWQRAGWEPGDLLDSAQIAEKLNGQDCTAL